ncbi:MAG: hypothetical protein RR574_07410, partial [Comamonas sp.]
RPAWQYWIQGALAFNPLAKATPKRKKADHPAAESGEPSSPSKKETAGRAGRRKTHPIFGSE